MDFQTERLSQDVYVLKDEEEDFSVEIRGGREVSLCFVVEMIDFERAVPEDFDHPICMTLNIFPVEEELSDEYVDKVKQGKEFSHVDSVSYGSTAPVEPDVYNASHGNIEGNGVCFDSYEQAQDFIEEELPEQCQKVASMVAFHLDKSWNKVGDNGWDTIRSMVV